MRAPHPLGAFLNPRSIAVIGASTVLHKTGGRRWRSQVEAGFPGALYPIHPTAREILGHKAYRSLRDVPGPVDLAVVLVRPDLVPGVIRDCAALEVPAVNVITAGFGETGPEGKRSEREMVEILRRSGGRLIGPNCAGIFSAGGRVNVLGWPMPAGAIAVVSQSGNMALTFAQFAREKGLGFSRLITIGNAADVRLPDCVDYLLTDPETRVIVVYLEGLQALEGRALFELVRRHPTRKPIVVFKPGQTEGGRRAALSHTGALAGEDRVVDAALRQCGIVRVGESEEAWDAAMALALMPPMSRSALGVVSDGGGHATVVTDTAERHGLTVPALGPATRAALADILPPRSGITNPVDFAGVSEEEPEIIPRVVDVCLADPELGGVIFAGHFGGYFRIATEAHARREEAAARELVTVVRRHRKPLLLHTIYGAEPIPTLETLRQAGIPVYRSLEAVAKAAAALWRHGGHGDRPGAGHRRSRPDPARVAALLPAAGTERTLVLEPAAREILRAYGIAVPPWRVCESAGETMQAARELGPRVALKLVAPGLVHKSDIGGVLLDVGVAEAGEAHGRLLERGRAAGVREAQILVTSMIPDGVETIVGTFRDPQFGPVVMFGLGGVLVEALDDVVFRLAPLDDREARAMLDEVRGHRIFRGVRGRPPCDLDAATDLLVRVSELAVDHPALVELDLNPVFLRSAGAAIADARIVVSAPAPPAS